MVAEKCQRVFAYGSLMWNPGFEFVRVRPARLFGYHRCLCVYSQHYRGTAGKPGLVLGLDQGGSCVGLVYDVTDDKWQAALAYIRARELIAPVYDEMVKTVAPVDASAPVAAITYVVNRHHQQYAPPMDTTKTIKLIKQGHGTSGSSVDYFWSTITHLRGLGILDKNLEGLARHLPLSSRVHP